MLGLGPRDEYAMIDPELAAVEFLDSEDIRHWLTSEPTGNRPLELAGTGLLQLTVLPGEDLCFCPAQDMTEQQGGLSGIGTKRGFGEPVPGLDQGFAYHCVHDGSVSNAVGTGMSRESSQRPGPVEDLRTAAVAIFEAGVRAADPRRAVRENLRFTATDRPVIAGRTLDVGGILRIVAFGKAAVAMAEAAAEMLSVEDFPGPGVVAVNPENFARVDRFRVFTASHPVPDAVGVAAAVAIEEYVAQSQESDALLVLVSGGGSALLPAPAPGISLEDKMETTRLLLSCGVPIQNVNCVRKHLSGLKGGGLARIAFPARVESLILSDVIGDDLSSIASGPTAPDPTTFLDAREILQEHDLLGSIPAAVRRRVEEGVAGEIVETPTEQDPVFSQVDNRLVGSNAQSLEATRRWAESLGYTVRIASSELCGEARLAAADLHRAARRHRSDPRPLAVLAGGETTVTLRGQGSGGRNQEMALAFAQLCQTEPLGGDWVFLSGGTDGRDGPTDAAGGVVDAGTVERMRRSGLDPVQELNRNNSNVALAAAEDLLVTGPTGTNVADLQVLLLAGDPLIE